MTTKTHINTVGASYFAVNAFGWATARSPWEAISKLDLTSDGRAMKLGSGQYLQATREVQLWYLPDESKFVGTKFYAPVDAEGSQYGIPLYGGKSPHNERVIHDRLTGSTIS
jgi:hypothetical protein